MWTNWRKQQQAVVEEIEQDPPLTIRVLGDGDAFDTSKTNSSFLIDVNGERILFDCGYNVFAKLRATEWRDEPDIIKKIDTVWISHAHDDHIGSLQSLVFYRYFKFGRPTIVYGNDRVQTYLEGINYEYKSSRMVPTEIVNFKHIQTFKYYPQIQYYLDTHFEEDKWNIVALRGNHIIEDTFGILIFTRNNIVGITGDTKAYYQIEDVALTIKEYFNIPDDNIHIFHDFSTLDAPSRNVHACKTDIAHEYSEWFKKRLIFYHYSECELEGKTFVFGSGDSVDEIPSCEDQILY